MGGLTWEVPHRGCEQARAEVLHDEEPDEDPDDDGHLVPDQGADVGRTSW
jgi:hypothetical protein